MTILISGDHLVDIPETLTGTCEVYVVDAENRSIEDVMRQKLPLVPTAAPQPEGEEKDLLLFQSGEVPGSCLRRGQNFDQDSDRLQISLPFAVVDEKAVENYQALIARSWTSGAGWTSAPAHLLEDPKNADFDKITLEIRDEDSVPVGSEVGWRRSSKVTKNPLLGGWTGQSPGRVWGGTQTVVVPQGDFLRSQSPKVFKVPKSSSSLPSPAWRRWPAGPDVEGTPGQKKSMSNAEIFTYA